MPKLATVPLTIDPDAAAFLARIGQERELELMIDHARETIPYLRSLHIVLHDFPETGPPGLTIEAHRDPYPGENDHSDMRFDEWMLENFPPEVLEIFCLMTVHHTDEG